QSWVAWDSTSGPIVGDDVWNNHDTGSDWARELASGKRDPRTEATVSFPAMPSTQIGGERLLQFIAGNHQGLLPNVPLDLLAPAGAPTPAPGPPRVITADWTYASQPLVVPVTAFFIPHDQNGSDWGKDVSDPETELAFTSLYFNPARTIPGQSSPNDK